MNILSRKTKSNHLFLISSAFIFLSSILFFSCQTSNVHKQNKKSLSISLTGKAVLSQNQLTAYFISKNPEADINQVYRLAGFYIEEANTEGINSDVAFAQMCHETGFLKFGNLVTSEMHNYCGLGAINAENPGLSFDSEQLGVRAHIQHLHAYGTTSDKTLQNPVIDPRYKYVNPRGKAPTIFELAGTWAADKAYGEKLNAKLIDMNSFRKWKGTLALKNETGNDAENNKAAVTEENKALDNEAIQKNEPVNENEIIENIRSEETKSNDKTDESLDKNLETKASTNEIKSERVTDLELPLIQENQ